MSRVALVGVDAMDEDLVDRLGSDLPNILALRRMAPAIDLTTTFPPDSDTAWASIATSSNPARHGILRFVDPLEKSHGILNLGASNEALSGNTYWDIAARAGQRCLAIFPHLGYPMWDGASSTVVRGGGRVATVQARPPALLSHYPQPSIVSGVRGLPRRDAKSMRAYAESLSRLARSDAAFTMRLLRAERWDLVTTYFATLDAVGHFFWGYFDPADPLYERGGEFESVIPATYRMYDEIVGQIANAISADTTLMVISDHGHGPRPRRLVNINGLLKKGGFLVERAGSARAHLAAGEIAKRTAVRTISRRGWGRQAGAVLRHFPGMMRMFTRPARVNWSATLAYASDMSGIKAYSYGGVIINRDLLGARDYEATRQSILDLIRRSCVTRDGATMLKFACRREELYTGPHLDRYPDILMELAPEFGIGWGTGDALTTAADSYNLVPGSHRAGGALCLVRPAGWAVAGTQWDVRDIAPTVLDLLEVDQPGSFEGTSKVRRAAVRHLTVSDPDKK